MESGPGCTYNKELWKNNILEMLFKLAFSKKAEDKPLSEKKKYCQNVTSLKYVNFAII